MKETLYGFTHRTLFDAVERLLEQLKIRFEAQSKLPMSFNDLYASMVSSPMPKALEEVLSKISETYLIGQVDEETLQGRTSTFELGQTMEGKYHTMVIFAVDIKRDESLTRSEVAALTRGFNRLAPEIPVVVFIRNGKYLSMATCERSEYKQQGRQGEKLGKVSILRDINCTKPHRGHLDIIDSLGEKAYPTFEDLYKHWMAVFSSELLTKKFYTELSEWYAWVIGSGKVKFPNDISTTEDDAKYNHEAVIRLITRLIFVWFLKQKHLIPKEFFDEKAIRENFIENFDPHSTNTLFYNPEESKYYRLILQNLFFAMLNRPIMDEESGEGENRRFRKKERYRGGSFNEEFNVNNLMRYQSEFKRGGDEKLVALANSCIPFLNGGLFECLDHKDRQDPLCGMYYDGFSENKDSLAQLSFPDYFFFGDEVGRYVDLSRWYDDKKKKNVKVRGLIDILSNYNFTVEENTPFDQEVSLDPELLGKVFENLLASYNPETNTTARKQTGSFYTPRDIVKYMVDESLIAHLNRTCPDIEESVFRNLFNYSVDTLDLPQKERKNIMTALYECKVLDPACGSGAFPMGILQQMVHALRKLDPTNEMWREFILEKSLEKDKEAYKTEDPEERARLRADIEQSFNRQVNDPDYARKLYLIENCIYGVDIQPIATQISKLRFFISLVAEQKPIYDEPLNNFGIRPLPNLEAKFVAANTLLPLEKESNLFGASDALLKIKNELAETNHKIFLAKNNKVKRILKRKIEDLRNEYAKELQLMGSIGPSSANTLASWDMFNQNMSASFFDSEWMFGLTDGFDIVIGNPPYVIVASDDPLKQIFDKKYKVAGGGKRNLYHLFYERGITLLKDGGAISYITPDTYLAGNDTTNLRKFFSNTVRIIQLILYSERDKVFENVNQAVAVCVMIKGAQFSDFRILIQNESKIVLNEDVKSDAKYRFRWQNPVIHKINLISTKILDFFYGNKGDVNLAIKKGFFIDNKKNNSLPLVRGVQLGPYIYYGSSQWCLKSALSKDYTAKERIVFQEVANMGLKRRVKGTILRNVILGDSCNFVFPKSTGMSIKASLAVINSKVVNYYFKFYNQTNHVPIGEFKQIPFPVLPSDTQKRLASLVEEIFIRTTNDFDADISDLEEKINLIVYHIYNLEYTHVKIIDPDTLITEKEYNSYNIIY